ncbi:hypothetical protein LEP1GSC058_0880 [Leptospira fainei serovar Hurstbridge str. BUT 6]|uniref:Uncharacterized protein n=1 Tax=Leptospira fainei serovar Hurstbridge str. BUT 6 TaxID=1193011 RepID=S3UQI7_9LEPT|nr:hypothetical protein LEP1GSC058_0880 [Leptospira fainei serovar Hurstbridge str. BUT 6]
MVTITFTALPTVADKNRTGKIGKPQTLVTLIHERLANDVEIKMHQHGWTNILSGLEKWQGQEE